MTILDKRDQNGEEEQEEQEEQEETPPSKFRLAFEIVPKREEEQAQRVAQTTRPKATTWVFESQESLGLRGRSAVLWSLSLLLILSLILMIFGIIYAVYPIYSSTNLGSVVCCSPVRIWPGQYLKNGPYYFWFQNDGNFQFLRESPENPNQLVLLWETNTANQGVTVAELTETGVLELQTASQVVKWSTPVPAATPSLVVPFTLSVSEDGHVYIRDSVGTVAYDHPPVSLSSSS